MNSGAFSISQETTTASWPWLAEIIRTTACQMFALSGEDPSRQPPRHSNEILSEVRHRLGSVDSFSPEKDDLRAIFRLLILLEDFAHIRRGSYLPRETRILLIAPGYARIAGGLPLLFSEFKEYGVSLCATETIGRIATVSQVIERPQDWSFSNAFIWGELSLDERFDLLLARTGSISSGTSDNVFFYNPKKREYYRGRRWQKAPVRGEFAIARREGKTNAYFLVLNSGMTSKERWHDISYEDAKSWLVAIDQAAGTVHSVEKHIEHDVILLDLPMNMPTFCIEALVSIASRVSYEKPLWKFRVPLSLGPVVDHICKISALHQYE
ncbi:hypothetical protein BH09VER1_BH09VER1_16160 [soil metagenome]